MIGKKIYNILTGSTGITDIVGSNIYRIELPDEDNDNNYVPSIVFLTKIKPEYNGDRLLSDNANVDMLLTHFDYNSIQLLVKEVRNSLECVRFEDDEIKIFNSKIDSIDEDTLTKENDSNSKLYLKGIQFNINYINK